MSGLGAVVLRLRRLARLAEDLARRRLVEADRGVDLADRLEHRRRSDRGELGRPDRLVPRARDERRRGEVVDLGRPGHRQRVDERRVVEQVRLDELDRGPRAAASASAYADASPPDDARDLVALFEQEPGEQRAVLASHAGDERAGRRHPRASVRLAPSGDRLARVTQNAPVDDTPITDAIRSAPPGLHGADEYWGLAWAALEWLERNVRPGWSTLETGSGASTIVFAAAGARHEAVTPDAGEESGSAPAVSSSASTRPTSRSGSAPRTRCWRDGSRDLLDLVLIDGAHGFPYPILDWWHLASPRPASAGTVLLDDAYLPAVAAIVDFARSSDAWRVEDAVSFRTARLTKLADEPPPFMAGADAAQGRMRFSYLPPHRRVVASARQRLFSTRAGLWAVRRAAPSLSYASARR